VELATRVAIEGVIDTNIGDFTFGGDMNTSSIILILWEWMRPVEAHRADKV
jgi:hypothetical protein